MRCHLRLCGALRELVADQCEGENELEWFLNGRATKSIPCWQPHQMLAVKTRLQRVLHEVVARSYTKPDFKPICIDSPT